VYDGYSRPFVPDGFSARIVAVTADSGKPAEVSIPFGRSPGEPVLVSRVPALGLPAAIAVRVRFQAGDQEYRFDFPFLDYSKEPR
jgi:hypothetical protein